MGLMKPRYMQFTIVDDFLNPTATLPALTMDINPSTMTQTFTKKINRYPTFTAFVEEFWGEELDNVACSGSTGGFMLFEQGGGLTSFYRNRTQAYLKFKQLLDLYRNNGNIYDNTGAVIKKGSIILDFDTNKYSGFFENFSYNEDANSPFRFTFDFSFNVLESLLKV